jgi:hypothetical protein
MLKAFTAPGIAVVDTVDTGIVREITTMDGNTAEVKID